MAFYPDELSPIDRLRNAANADFADINLISKSRRQWKSLILGKKDPGMNSFATITEEKEEEISNDGSQPSNGNRTGLSGTSVHNKRISFPKPRKYISRDRLDEEENPAPKKLNSPVYGENAKTNLAEVKQLIRGKKDNDFGFPKTEADPNYFGDDPGKKWKEMATTSAPLLGWPKKEEIKTSDAPKGKFTEKKKSGTAPSMNSVRSSDSKSQKKTQVKSSSKQSPPEEEKKMPEKSAKALNMRDVVNVYKNLTYGSKEEIKSFVEKLSFVKDDSTDKDKLSMMNLKALENKLKDFGKRPNKVEEKKKPKEAKRKGKSEKQNSKARIEQLARHKVVKVPATLNYTYSPESRSLSYASSDREQVLSRRNKKQSEIKVPWKYVGTQSVLDKNYLVYPSIPTTPPKKAERKSSESSKNSVKKEERKTQQKPNSTNRAKTSNEFNRRRPSSIMRFSGSNKSMNYRPSATTVCKIEFRPTGKIGDLDPDDPSLLVYLHGTKAINVKLPYADKQFSRVKFFRKYGSRVPLIKGVDRDAFSNDYQQNVSVKNIRLPSELSRYKFEKLLDFDEDIQNLNDFLNSQSMQGPKRKTKNSSPREESSTKSSPKVSPDMIIEEISQDIESLRYLPDTEENRKIIAKFFDELDQKIEMTKAQKFVENAADHYGQMIPIMIRQKNIQSGGGNSDNQSANFGT